MQLAIKTDLLPLAAAVLLVCLASEGHATALDDAKSALIDHANSGSTPDPQKWSRFVAAYREANAPKQQAEPAAELPKFKWYQTKTKLMLTVMIPESKEETIKFGADSVSVSATNGRNGKKCALELPLFKAIKKGSTKRNDKAIYLTMKKKKKESYWARLTKTKPSGSLKRAMEVDWANWVDEEDASKDDDEIDEDDVQVLTTANFDSWVSKQKLALVEFYAPWCGHCKQLKPEWAKAATELAEKGSSAKLAKVDATAHPELQSRYDVSGYPTLKLFRGDLTARDSKGARTAAEIVEYMLKQEAPAVTKLGPNTDFSDAKSWLETTTDFTGLVGTFKDGSSLSEQYHQIADELRDDLDFASIDAADAAEEQIALHTVHHEKPQKYTGKLTKEALLKWVRLNALPVLANLSEAEARGLSGLEDKYRLRELPFLYVFISGKSSTEVTSEASAITAAKAIRDNEEFTKAATAVSTAVHGRYSVVTVDLGEKERLEQLGLKRAKIPDPEASQPQDWDEEEDGPWDAPEVDDPAPIVAIDSVDGKEHYALDSKLVVQKQRKGMLQQVLEEFVKNHEECVSTPTSCKLKKVIKSAAVPAANDEQTVTVVGSTFNEIVMDESKDVLIEFYAPWCGHCKKLAPVYEKLAAKTAGNPYLVVAKMDATENDIPDSSFDVTGFPTIYLKPAGKPAALYEGERDLKAFLELLEKEATHVPLSIL
jgi:protein disulfide-isomerase-like protein